MNQQPNYITLGELVAFVLILMFGIFIFSFVNWKDTHELQRRVGTLEQRCKQP